LFCPTCAEELLKQDIMNHKFFALIIFLFLCFSCKEKDSIKIEYQFNIQPSEETQVDISWDNFVSNQSVYIEVDTNNQFLQPIVETTVESILGFTSIQDLDPATDYFIKIEVKENDEIVYTQTDEFSTSYISETVRYPSTDEVELCASLCYVSSKISDSSKTIIFLHAFMQNRSYWKQTKIPKQLIKEGNLVVLIDFRGHGQSTYNGDVFTLSDRPWELRDDFDATLAFLETNELPCSGEVIVIGASMGACVTTVVCSYENIKGGVAVSAVEGISRAMFDAPLSPKGVFYIAGELDVDSRNRSCADDAINLFNITADPKQVEVVPNTQGHGAELILPNSNLYYKVLDWVRNL
jgi:pimeloyl-ACP methyl ester carboxylesterase